MLRTDYSATDHTRIWEHLNEIGELGNDAIVAAVPLVQQGQVSVTPSAANTPTLVAVTYPVPFNPALVPKPMAIAATSTPGTQVTGVGVAFQTVNGFNLYVTRTNTTATNIYWLAIGLPA